MSSQTIADAFAPAEAAYRAQVMEDTWGHLAPHRNALYRGHITFALGCCGSDGLNPTVLECEFVNRKHGEIDGSPWFHDAMNDFLQSLGGNEGAVYRFDGAFRNYEFKGSVRQLQLL